MTERRSSADLGVAAEASLSAFPFPERDWESSARAVERRLSASVLGSTDAGLLGAPLPGEPSEPSSLPATATPLTNSGVRPHSLTDLARRSVEQKRAAEREMARASLALAAQRRPSAEVAQALREAVNTVRAVEAQSPMPSVGAAQAPHGSSLRAATATAKKSRWPAVALIAGALALAAGVLLWSRQPAPTPLSSAFPSPSAAPEKAESPASRAPALSDSADQLATAAAAPAAGLSQEGARPAAEVQYAKLARATASGASAVSAAGAGPSADRVARGNNQPSPAAEATDLPVAKVLPSDPALRPADSTGGAIPVKPSTGAVQAALGSVMSGARRCVAGDDAASSAVVVFASDGHVESVTVHGPAAGKPSGSCIEGQLSRARVQPFAATRFSIHATVRPD